MNYYEYLLSPQWLDKVEAVRRRSGGRCERIKQPGYKRCGGPADDVHHKTYERLYCEELSDLVDVCRDCHRELHNRKMDGSRRGYSDKLRAASPFWRRPE